MFNSRLWLIAFAVMSFAFPGCGTHSNAGPGPTLADTYAGVYSATQPGSLAGNTVTIADFGDGTLKVALPGGDTVHLTGVNYGAHSASVSGSTVYLQQAAGSSSLTLIVDLTHYILTTPKA